MRHSLYDEHAGYYRQPRSPFGTKGDFYTAVQLMPVFGELLAGYVDAHAPLEPDSHFEVIDLGAGRTGLAEHLSRWRYHPVDWNLGSWPDSVRGVVIANEFFDALPVHLLRRTGTKWCEVMVEASDGGSLQFAVSGAVEGELLDYAVRYGDAIPDGGVLEANLEMRRWLAAIAGSLRKGRLLVIDYGYHKRDLLRFPDGTLMSYQQHMAHTDILTGPGSRDITALVNFTDMKRTSEELGLELVNDGSLAAWILEASDEEKFQQRWKEVDSRWRMQWKHLMFGLGEVFRVLEFTAAPTHAKRPPEEPEALGVYV
jgi:SAM-dependent MidA family methyltransferase